MAARGDERSMLGTGYVQLSIKILWYGSDQLTLDALGVCFACPSIVD